MAFRHPISTRGMNHRRRRNRRRTRGLGCLGKSTILLLALVAWTVVSR
jgi:hypothetical protein